MGVILKAENISKQYRLGLVGTGTLSHDLNRFWARIRGNEDPYLKVGTVNNRTTKADSDYVWALKNINFEVKKGEVLGIIGKNGAGKSTLLKLLSRVTGPTTGTIKTKGTIASLLEVGTGFHPELTGRENVFLNGAILGMRKVEIASKIDEIITFSGCEKYIDTPVKRYSSGMRVRLAFAVAAHLEPDILIVDEVLAVGDAEFQKKAIGKMKDISQGEGRTVLFVSHNMAAVKNLCTRGIVLVNGESVFSGDAISCVNYYLNETRNINRDVTVFTDSHRLQKTSKEIELIKIKSINRNITVRSDIVFEVFLKNKKNFNKEVTITGTICDEQEGNLGSFFSESFTTHEREFSKVITIPNHNLSIGQYYLNISISGGSIKTSNLVVIDHAYKALGFEVLGEGKANNYVIKWHKSWGNFFFQSKISND